MKTERVFVIHCWLGAWTEPGQWFFTQYCIYLLIKPMRTDLLLKHAPAAKQSDIDKTKSIKNVTRYS